jgi:uncharacterized protein
MKILSAANYREVPWKNGGGLTREVFVQWSDDSQSRWDFRISLATVADSGPFSTFDGVDRTIAVLEGRGFRLDFAGEQSMKVDQSSEPFCFSGDVAAHCEVVTGSTTDLNVMSTRKAFRHSLRKFHCTEAIMINPQVGWNALVCNTAVVIRSGDRHFGVQRFDTVIDIGEKIEVTPLTKGDIYFVNVVVV